jgi:hypothetical protein
MGYMDVEKAIKTAVGMDSITPQDRLVWFVLAHHRNSKTGKCFPSIDTIMEETGLSRSSVKRSNDHLEELGVLKIVEGGGRVSNNYHLLIYHVDEKQVEDLDALHESPDDGGGSERTRFSENLQPVQREPSGGSERTCSRFSENPESGSLTPEGKREVNPAKARLASADASAASIQPPHSGENGKDNSKDNSKDSGSVPNPQVSSAQSIPIDPLIIDTPWEQESEDALLVWNTSNARPYVLDDFLLIEAKFGERIQAVLDGHGTLPLIIKWACHISRDFRDLSNTGEFRAEFPLILLKITGYILAGELTPRIFTDRVEQVYLANLTFGNGVPNPMDVLEEEYINWCDENETEMDMLNPWAEGDAKEAQTEFYPWEDDSRSETTPDSAVALPPREEGRDVTDGDEEALRQDQMELRAVSVSDNDDDDFPEEVPDVDTLPEPEDSRTTRRGARLPRPSHIYSGRMPLPRSNDQPQFAPAPDNSAPAEEQDASDYEVEDEAVEEESGPVDLTAVWKKASDTELDILDLWLIVREEELPSRDPDRYLADVIRWTMQFWPGRDQLKAGSRSFKQHFKEIHEDYARNIGNSLSSSRPSKGEQANETPALAYEPLRNMQRRAEAAGRACGLATG